MIPHQTITAAATSVNQIASTFNRCSFANGSLNLDYGGGRFDTSTTHLRHLGVQNVVYDPFNRSETHNLATRLTIAQRNGADTVTVNNVLNVLADDYALEHVVAQAANGLRDEGTAYFLIYEGDRSGRGAPTSKGFQRNAKTAEFLSWVAKSFDDITLAGNLITAYGPQHTEPSLFGLSSVRQALMLKCRERNLMRYPRLGVGKWIGGSLYVHRSAEEAIPAPLLAQARALIPAVDYAVVKWTPANNALSFIESPDFLTVHEPIVGNAYRVASGEVRVTRQKANPQVYHHKWLFVRPDYAGFDVAASMLRSLQWTDYSTIDKSRIGQQAYWHATLDLLGLAR